MNEQSLYSEMLEIPVNTCSINYTQPKKRKKKSTKKQPDVKELLLEKINDEPILDDQITEDQPALEDSVTIKPKQAKKFKFSVIGVQIAVICLLLGVIIFSNLYMEQSGIATFLNSVFSSSQKADNRVYSDFTANLPTDSDATITDGVMCFSAKGSVYSPCDGVISSISKENEKYTIEVTHSTKFKTVIRGIDYAYQELGSAVYGNVPIGYSLGENVELCFYSENSLITNYTIDGETVIWAV